MSGEGGPKALVFYMETCQEHPVDTTFSLHLMVAGFEEWKQKNCFFTSISITSLLNSQKRLELRLEQGVHQVWEHR